MTMHEENERAHLATLIYTAIYQMKLRPNVLPRACHAAICLVLTGIMLLIERNGRLDAEIAESLAHGTKRILINYRVKPATTYAHEEVSS